MALTIAGSPQTSVPRKPTVALFGDSITSFTSFVVGGAAAAYPSATSPAAASTNFRSDAYWTWAQMRLNNRLQAVANAGVGGNTTAQMLARINTDITGLNPKPGWVLVQGGSNDSGVAATTISNLTAIYDAIRNAGMGVIITTCVPHQTDTWQGKVNRALRDYALTHSNCIFVDWLPYIQNPSTGAWATNLSDDGVHPNVAGASLMGKALADVLSIHFPPLDYLNFSSNVDTETLIPNPAFNGTGGTFTSGSGSIAANWTSRFSANATLSKVNRTDIQGEWQQVALASTGTTTGDMYAGWTAVVGDVLAGAVEFQTDSGGFSTVTDFALALADSGATIKTLTNRNSAGTGIGNQAQLISWPTQGTLVIPPFVATTTTGFLFCKFSATAGTVRFGRAWLKKVA